MAWSEACWDTLIDELPPVTTSAVRDQLTDWDGCITKLEAAVGRGDGRRSQAKGGESAEDGQGGPPRRQSPTSPGNANGSRATGINVPIVRRILANVPTYMICDDHEITDDWNLTQEWRNRVLGTNLGTDDPAQRARRLRRLPGVGQRPDGLGQGRQQEAPRQRRQAVRVRHCRRPGPRPDRRSDRQRRGRPGQGDVELLDRLRSPPRRRARHAQPSPVVRATSRPGC